MNDIIILGQMTCPNCGNIRNTDLTPCICGYNPRTGKVEKNDMEKFIQDMSWNNLSETAKERVQKEYGIVSTTTPVDGFPLFESIYLLEEKYGKHNLIKNI